MYQAGQVVVDISGNISGLKSDIDAAVDQIDKLAGKLTKFVSLPLAAGGTFATKLFADLELAEKSLERFVGGADQAAKEVDFLQSIARKGFSFNGLLNSERKLIGFGLTAKASRISIQTLTDATAALGGSEGDLSGLVTALGQIAAKGKVSAEEVLQLAERGIPAQKILQEQLNLTADQMANLGGAGISAAEGIEAILTGLNERFGGAADAQANTLTRTFQRARANIEIALAGLGEDISEALNLKQVINDISNFVTNASNAFQQLDPEIQRFIVLTGAAVAALGPLLLAGTAFVKAALAIRTAYQTITAAATAANTALLPQIAIIGGIALAIAALALTLKSAYDAFPDSGFGKFISRQIAFIKQQYEEIVNLFTVQLPNLITKALTFIGVSNPGFAALIADSAKVGAAIKDNISEALESDNVQKFTDAFKSNLSDIGGFFTDLYDKATAGQKNLTDNLDTDFKNLAKELENLNLGISEGAANGAIPRLKKEIEDLIKARDNAFDPIKIAEFNDQITLAQQRMDDLTSATLRFNQAIAADRSSIGNEINAFFENYTKGFESSIKKIPGQFDRLKDQLAQKSEQIAASFDQVLRQGLTNSIAGIAEAFGQLTADNNLNSFFDNILGVVASFASQFGKYLIALGVAKLKLDALFKAPGGAVAAIAAGAALVALSSAVNSSIRGPSFSGGNGGGATFSGSNAGFASNSPIVIQSRGVQDGTVIRNVTNASSNRSRVLFGS